MKKEIILAIISNEIKNIDAIDNSHGLDSYNIESYLTIPYEQDFFNPQSKNIEKHWIVLDENRNSQEHGYLIFYSENDKSFGIGTKTNMKKIPGLGTFIGIYGSFLDAVNSM